ncbi:hypothetical protein BGZ51_002608 [Haplosporangium sp. Z 767]|nr:hypothetical protein BGZ51_002608 [Haplosporangium sp. Z 767]KAF9186177.1 hypothetical protein BGZ50_002618 [Haplosporangium sp. Z 11]
MFDYSFRYSRESVPGVTLEDLVDQLIIPDYVNTFEQITRTKVFLMIYRKFLRPRELLEMFIERFEELGELDDEETKNTRLRICACLYYWLKNHPNDLIHRHTRQRVALFLRERVALFPCLSEIHMQLLPLASIHYFNSWRWPHQSADQHQQHHHHNGCSSNCTRSNSDSRSSSFSGPSLTLGSTSDSDSDSGFHDTASLPSEQVMDEDREWGLFDEDDVLAEAKKSQSMDSLTPFPHFYGPNNRYQSRSFPHLPSRDRRSSTGSLAHNSPCEMEAFVASRRGSASSINSAHGQLQHAHASSAAAFGQQPTSFAEGDLTPHQLQPMTTIPFINKRSSSQAYRQRASQGNSSLAPPVFFQNIMSNTGSNATFSSKESADEAPVHPLQGKANPLPPAPALDHLPMNTPFIDIKDASIAAQLTCVEFGLFKKLKPRDMLRQVWKTSKGSAAFQACIAHFNFISSWVGTMILTPSKAKNRAKMMEKFIMIAKILRDMGNFNTTMAIIGAMNTSSIHRLVQTRELLQGKEIWNTFEELQRLMSSERSFSEYRNALKVQKLPCIPYLGVHLGDLLSISEGNRDFRQDGTIHWQKFCLLAEVISMVMHFQSESYMIQPDPFISRVITDTHVLDDEELYTKSVGAEPGKLHHSRSLSKFNFF